MTATSLLANALNPTSTGLLSWARKFKHDIRQPEMSAFFFLVLSQYKNLLQLMHCFSWLDFTLAYQIVNITTCQDGGDVFTDRSSNLCYYFLGSWILGPVQ